MQLPQPGQRRFPVGIVLVVLWVCVFLTIFMVLAWRKMNPPARQGPVFPDSQQTAPEQAPADGRAPEDLGTP